MIIAVTGHRPDKIGGYDYVAPQRIWLREQMKQALINLGATRAISGMALGIDQDFAQVCIEMTLPYLAAIPFIGQESKWPNYSQDYYNWLLYHADEVIVVSKGSYAVWKMQVRNEWMVDHCDMLLAVWDGSDGGTGNCVAYAMKLKPDKIHRLNPMDFFRDKVS